jgi:hypothetical protein
MLTALVLLTHQGEVTTMSDFNQQTRKQDEQVPSSTPPSGQQTRQTQQGAIERNPADDQDAAKARPEDDKRPEHDKKRPSAEGE